MSKVDLYDIGLSEDYLQEALNYSREWFLARVAVQHQEIYRVITEDWRDRS